MALNWTPIPAWSILLYAVEHLWNCPWQPSTAVIDELGLVSVVAVIDTNPVFVFNILF